MSIKTIVMSVTMALSLGVTPYVVAAPVSAASQQATQSLVHQLTGLRSFSADFEQTTKANVKNNLPKKPVAAQHLNQKFTGVMKVERPGKFYWETTAPSKQLIVTSSKTIWIYDPDLQQVVRQTVSDQVANTPALLLSGNTAQIMQSYIVSQPDSSKNYYTLTPKNTEGSFQDLSIGFAKDGTPSVMVLNDALGQTTTINFSRVVKNAKIAASTFNFVPPKGTDIIDQ
ncbi:outer membrane lipoprotein carrier protein [Acinetobacter boissieri]|uniref:Outer-membrane lipoprotein carrier protein n=2 Tax=Acinetobacter boissieri TaxID=1219383 RepID=A0A1G6H7C4_9GAMM|nr:outer membrane lipoprotein carrier protein [Acinetobacter boissieri]